MKYTVNYYKQCPLCDGSGLLDENGQPMSFKEYCQSIWQNYITCHCPLCDGYGFYIYREAE